MIPIDTLEKLETISALKVYLYLYKKTHANGVIRISMNNIVDDSGIPRNSVKRGLQELLDNGVIEQIATGKGNHPNTYRVSKVDSPKVDPIEKHEQEIEGYRKAVGTRLEDDSSPKVDHTENDNIINNIIYKEFNLNNLLNKDINSLSLANDNHKLNDEQLGKLARRVLVEWYLPLAQPNSKSKSFFPMQMKLAKDLLVMYRTEQVLAGIYYWTKVEPPKDGMKSLMWLKFERKKVSHTLIALDYFKQEYFKKEHEVEEESRLAKVEIMKQKALEIAKQKAESKKKVDEMADDDFVNNLLGNLGKIQL
jgi:hypothetical protein